MQAHSNNESLPTECWDTEQTHPSDSSGKAQQSLGSSARSKSGSEAAATLSGASTDPAEQSDTIDQADVEASGNTGRDQEAYEGSGQLDSMPSRDRFRLIDTVFLRAEAIPEHEMKAITVCQWVGQMLALGLLLVEVALKFIWSDKQYITSKANQIWNFVAAIGCMTALLTCMGIMFRRIIRYRNKYWGRRRRVIVTLTCVEGCLAVVNTVVWAIPNLYVIIKDCEWFSTTINVCAFIKWMSWNSLFMVFVVEARNINFWKRNGKVLRKHGKDRIVMDAPWWNHAWIFVNWVAFESVTIALLVVNTTGYKSRFSTAKSRCDSFDYSCQQLPAGTGLLATLFASWILWILLWAYFILKALHDLHLRPWYRYKLANTAIRTQMRARLYGLIMFALSVVLLVFVKFYSCASYVQTYMGLGPLTIMETVMILSSIYFYMPKTPELIKPMLQVLLQEFSWTEEQKQERLQTRNQQLAELGQDAWLEPMFTFETAIKTFYFSALIYEYQEEGAAAAARKRNPTKATVGGFKLETAMNLYNLERFELLVEPAEDTKVLVCWNRDSVILTFRGTASMTNVLADLQAWQSPHPPDFNGVWSRPKVHAGFLRSWQANGLHRRVIARLKAIFESPGIDMENMRVVMTGHSLGGALATLAAYDIAREFSSLLGRDQVICYTFGSPRTGNHKFAKDYNLTVPDTWHVINARDIIPRSGKFFRLYKRPGQRVIINKMGDMIIRPSFVEISVAQSLPFQSRVTEHFLASYQASFIAVCSAQFGDKAFVDGMEGMRTLVSSGEVHDALSYETLDLKRMERLADWGGLTFFQLTGQLQKGVDRLHAQAVGSEPAKKQDKVGRLRCHDGVCWREDDDAVGDLREGSTLVQRTTEPSQRSLASSTLSKRRLSGHLGKPSTQSAASKHSSFASFEALATPGSEPLAEPGRERASGNAATENSHIPGTAAEVPHEQQGQYPREPPAAGARAAPGGEDDAGKSRAAAPQNRSAAPGDGGDVDVGQPSVRVATHSMSNGPLTHGTPAGVGAAPPQEAPGSSPKHAHWHLPRPHLRLPFRGGQPAVDDATPRPASPLGTAQDLLFKGGTEQQVQPLAASRAVAPKPPPNSVESPHSLAETHDSMVLQSSRNDRHQGAPSTSRDPQIAAALAEFHNSSSLAARRPPNAPESSRSSLSSWKSATLDDQLQRMEERGMFSEVLQDALQGREQEREAHHGFLHRSLHRPSLQSAVNESRNAVSMNEAERRVLKNLRRSSAGGALSERRSILGYAFSLQ